MSNSKELLKSYKDRILNLENENRQIAQDIKDIYDEMKAGGFSPAAMRKVIKEALETPEQKAKREAVEEVAEVYRANLGMLGGTPLGDAARKIISRKHKDDEPDTPDTSDPGADEAISKEQIDEARARGVEDAKAGKKIFDNPFTSGDPRRPAWDEGWCSETGTDGMELPEALRPKKKPKPDADAKPDDKPDDGKGGEG